MLIDSESYYVSVDLQRLPQGKASIWNAVVTSHSVGPPGTVFKAQGLIISRLQRFVSHKTIIEQFPTVSNRQREWGPDRALCYHFADIQKLRCGQTVQPGEVSYGRAGETNVADPPRRKASARNAFSMLLAHFAGNGLSYQTRRMRQVLRG